MSSNPKNKAKNKGPDTRLIAVNRKASHDYYIEEKFEAGIVLEGWELKSLRAGRANLKESYVIIKNSEAWLIGCHISALETASSHIRPELTRSRKLLLHRDELNKLIGATERKGYALVPLDLHWTKNKIKLNIALAKGKKQFDKRETERRKEWEREKQKLQKLKHQK